MDKIIEIDLDWGVCEYCMNKWVADVCQYLREGNKITQYNHIGQ